MAQNGLIANITEFNGIMLRQWKGQDKKFHIILCLLIEEKIFASHNYERKNHDHHDVIDSFYFGKLSLKDLISMTHKENILFITAASNNFKHLKKD